MEAETLDAVTAAVAIVMTTAALAYCARGRPATKRALKRQATIVYSSPGPASRVRSIRQGAQQPATAKSIELHPAAQPPPMVWSISTPTPAVDGTAIAVLPPVADDVSAALSVDVSAKEGEDDAATDVLSGPSSHVSDASTTSLVSLDLSNATLDEMAHGPVEKQRFLKARDYDEAAAAAQLRGYLQWRQENLPRASPQEAGRPEWCHFHGQATDGSPILHVYSARVDHKLGSNEDYANDLMACLDANLPRDSAVFITVLVDTRGSIGWANPSVNRNMVRLGQMAGKMLGQHFPERVLRIVVYPVPRIFSGVWSIIKPFLHPNTAAKVKLLGGSTRPSDKTVDEDSPVPSGLSSYATYPDSFREDMRPRHKRMERSSSSSTASTSRSSHFWN